MAKLQANTFDRLDFILGSRNKKSIGNNTVAIRTGETITITLHGHRIVELFSRDEIVFNFAGFPTLTTRDRINQFLPPGVRVFQHNHQQYLSGAENFLPLVHNNWVEIDCNSDYVVKNSTCGWLIRNDGSIFAKTL
jgi:hypothetical protein